MNRSTGAHLLTIKDLNDLAGKTGGFPVIDRMIIIDTRETSNKPRQQFPCYICGVDGEKDAFDVGIVQWVSGGPQVVRVRISVKALTEDKKCQFWDRAPTPELLMMYPFPKMAGKKWKRNGDTFEEVKE